MIAIELRGVAELERKLGELERALPGIQERAVREASLLVHRRLKERMSASSGFHPFWGREGAAGEALAVRSGQSRARLTPGGQVLRSGDRVFASVGSPDRHVAFLEAGGTISGRPYLSLPLASSQTAQGVDRLRGKSLRDVPGVFFIRSLAGRLFAAREVGRGRSRRVEFLRLLVRSVTLRGRHLFASTRRQVEPEVLALTQRQVSLGLRGL